MSDALHTFDSLCDKSAPGALVSPEELWAAVVAAATASKENATPKEDETE
jgi:hypothetical protein